LLESLAAARVDALTLAEQVREFPVAGCWLAATMDLRFTERKLGGKIRYNPDFKSH